MGEHQSNVSSDAGGQGVAGSNPVVQTVKSVVGAGTWETECRLFLLPCQVVVAWWWPGHMGQSSVGSSRRGVRWAGRGRWGRGCWRTGRWAQQAGCRVLRGRRCRGSRRCRRRPRGRRVLTPHRISPAGRIGIPPIGLRSNWIAGRWPCCPPAPAATGRPEPSGLAGARLWFCRPRERGGPSPGVPGAGPRRTVPGPTDADEAGGGGSARQNRRGGATPVVEDASLGRSALDGGAVRLARFALPPRPRADGERGVPPAGVRPRSPTRRGAGVRGRRIPRWSSWRRCGR